MLASPVPHESHLDVRDVPPPLPSQHNYRPYVTLSRRRETQLCGPLDGYIASTRAPAPQQFDDQDMVEVKFPTTYDSVAEPAPHEGISTGYATIRSVAAKATLGSASSYRDQDGCLPHGRRISGYPAAAARREVPDDLAGESSCAASGGERRGDPP